jgi:replicative DNA helicase
LLDLATIKKQASITKVAEASGLTLIRESDDEFKAVCCFHTDKSPSLSFTESRGVYWCFGCGAAGSAIDFVAKYYDIPFLEAAVRTAELAGLSAADINMEPQLVDTAIFTDEHGKPLYGEHRYEPGHDGKKKSFTQFHYDQEGNQHPNLPPRIRRVLYDLPAVLGSDVVFLVEGKKDVDTLKSWDFVATTKTSGGRGEWYREYTESLIGKIVIILPDQEAGDKPGASYARKVSMALNGKAKSVLIVNVTKGKDVTQFKELGGTKEDLLALIDAANQPDNSPTKRTQEILRKRGMPEAVESERLILGSILRGHSSFEDVPMLTSEDFSQANNARIFACIAGLSDKGGSIDTLAVGQMLKHDGYDLADYLMEISSELPPLYQFDWHVTALQEASRARKFIAANMHAVDSILLGGKMDDAVEMVSKAAECTSLVVQSENRMQHVSAVAGNLDSFFAPKPMGILTGIAELDRMTRGIKEGKLYIVAGRPGEGKSAIATQLGLWAVKTKERHRVHIHSFEMSRDEVLVRMICQAGELDATALEEGLLTEEQRATVAEIAYRLNDCNLFIDDVNDWTLLGFRNQMKQARLRGELPAIVIIDYLQLIRFPGKERRDIEIGHITSGLKAIAMEFGITIVLLSQLSRDGVKLNRKPILSDLKDSGSIEADADVVIFVWQDFSKDNKDDDYRNCQLILGKNRKGSVGEIDCYFKKSSTLFLPRL